MATTVQVSAVGAPRDGRIAVVVDVEDSACQAREARLINRILPGDGAPARGSSVDSVNDRERHGNGDCGQSGKAARRQRGEVAAKRRQHGEAARYTEEREQIAHVAQRMVNLAEQLVMSETHDRNADEGSERSAKQSHSDGGGENAQDEATRTT